MTAEPAPRLRGAVLVVVLAVTVLAVAIAVRQQDAIGPDGVALLSLARHLGNLRPDLFVTAYWSPLVPAATALVTACGPGERLAAHLVLAAAAPVLAFFTFRLADLVQIPRVTAVVCAICTGASAAVWAGGSFTTDVWGAAFLLISVCRLLGTTPDSWRRTHVVTGLWFGLGGLARHSTLPAAIGTLCLVALLGHWAARPLRVRARAALVIVGTAALTVLPWVAAVSAQRGTPTWTTSVLASHAILNQDVPGQRQPCFSSLRAVEPGRLLEWENADITRYDRWSPFDSARNARWQVEMSKSAVVTEVRILWTFTFLGAGFVCAVLATLHRLRRRDRSPPWTQAALPVVAVAAIYVPVTVAAVRYFWPAGAFVVVCLAGGITALCARATRLAPRTRDLVAAALVFIACALAPVQRWFGVVPSLTKPPRSWAIVDRVAAALHAAGATGPIVSDRQNGMPIALSAGIPFHGVAETATRAEVDAAGADTLVLAAYSPWLRWVASDPSFAKLDVPGAADDATIPLVFIRRR